MELCEGDAELWSFKELQIFNIFAVQNFDVNDLVKYFGKLNSENYDQNSVEISLGTTLDEVQWEICKGSLEKKINDPISEYSAADCI